LNVKVSAVEFAAEMPEVSILEVMVWMRLVEENYSA